MRNNTLFKYASISAILIAALAVGSGMGWAYSDGGGREHGGQTTGSGASINTNSSPSYFPLSDGITDHASASAASGQVDEEFDRGWMRSDDYTSYTEGIALSSIAWDETLSVPKDVRRLAVILENMMMSGAVSPTQAFSLLNMYIVGKHRNQGKRRY